MCGNCKYTVPEKGSRKIPSAVWDGWWWRLVHCVYKYWRAALSPTAKWPKLPGHGKSTATKQGIPQKTTEDNFSQSCIHDGNSQTELWGTYKMRCGKGCRHKMPTGYYLEILVIGISLQWYVHKQSKIIHSLLKTANMHLWSLVKTSILGKTVRKRSECVVPEYSDVPADLIKDNSWVTLTGDIMFVIQVPFLVSGACQIGLVTTEYLPARTAKAIANNINWVVH